MHIDHKRLRELRLEQMLTQGELGKLAGLTLDTVNTAEAGHSISPKTARKLVTALGVTPKDLLPGKDPASQDAGQPEKQTITVGNQRTMIWNVEELLVNAMRRARQGEDEHKIAREVARQIEEQRAS